MKYKVGDKVLWKYDSCCPKTIRTIDDVTENGRYWITGGGCASGWWREDELEPYIQENQDKMRQSKIPPLGVMPRFIWTENRIKELQAAIIRFVKANRPIPAKITEEYNELTSKLEIEQ